MKSQKENLLREMQLAFIGKMMAGISHEFKNHLAIIKELNGLIEDLLLLEESGPPADSDRYRKITSGINERIGQAAEMCRFLSGFSHRMDQPLSSISIAEILHEKVYLLRRFSQQKQVELIASFEEDMPQLFNNPAMLQFAVFCILWPAFELLEPDSRIEISGRGKGRSVEVTVKLEGKMKQSEGKTPWEELLPDILQILEAEYIQRVNMDGNKEIVLIIASIDNQPGDDL